MAAYIPRFLVSTYLAYGLFDAYKGLNIQKKNQRDLPVTLSDKVNNRINTLTKEMRIKNPVSIQASQYFYAAANGFDGTVSKPTIYIYEPNKLSDELLSAFCAHELSHIKNYDILRLFLLKSSLFVGVASFPLLSRKFFYNSLQSGALLGLTKIIDTLYLIHRERRADIDAIPYMKKDELAAITNFFSSSFTHDFTHPSDRERSEYFKNAFYQRETEDFPIHLFFEESVDKKSVEIKLSSKTVTEIRNHIRYSSKENHLIDMVGIVIKKHLPQDNIQINRLNGVSTYTSQTVETMGGISDEMTEDLSKTLRDVTSSKNWKEMSCYEEVWKNGMSKI